MFYLSHWEISPAESATMTSRIYTNIYPLNVPKYECPICGRPVLPKRLLWQGVHVCVDAKCESCEREFLFDLPSGQGAVSPLRLDVQTLQFVEKQPAKWFANILRDIIARPSNEDVPFAVCKNRECSNIVVINCLDFCYGHCLCKLFSAQDAIDSNPGKGVVVIVNSNLEWLVPDAVAEKWVVHLPISRMKGFYPKLNDKINHQFSRFKSVALFSGYNFSTPIDVSYFSSVPAYDVLNGPAGRVTFVWREDNCRSWVPNAFLRKLVRHFHVSFAAKLQKYIVVDFFKRLRELSPQVECVVSGLGTRERFPPWIKDLRTNEWCDAAELRACDIYSGSQLVVGVHGSHLIIPIGHAGMAISLLAAAKWRNVIEDMAVRASHPRDALLRYRNLPVDLSPKILAQIAHVMLAHYHYSRKKLVDHP